MTDNYKTILDDALALLGTHPDFLALLKRKQDLEAGEKHHTLEAAPLTVRQPKLII